MSAGATRVLLRGTGKRLHIARFAFAPYQWTFCGLPTSRYIVDNDPDEPVCKSCLRNELAELTRRGEVAS